jgi:hypothetical protein
MIVSAIAGSSPQPHTSAFALACSTFSDQLDAGGFERLDQLHERVDIAADHSPAPFHPLDRRQRQAGQLGQLALVDTKEGARSAQLRGCNDGRPARRLKFCYLHFIR